MDDYEAVIMDAAESFTEGITEKEGKQTTANKMMSVKPRQTTALEALCLPPLMGASGRQTHLRSLVTQALQESVLFAET